MGFVPPISGLPEEDPLIAAYQAHTTQGPSPAETTRPAETEDRIIDNARMHQDYEYVVDSLNYIHFKAQNLFIKGRYVEAQEQYDQFFKYLRQHKVFMYYGVPLNILPAVFENAWTLQLLDRHKEAERFLNQELLRIMEPVLLSPQKPALKPIETTLEQWQQTRIFPGPAHMETPPSMPHLTQLVDMLRTAQQPQLALQLLGYIEVRHLLEVHRTQRLAQGLSEESRLPATRSNPASLLPNAQNHFGLPVAPVLPVAPEVTAKIRPHTHLPEYHVDKVEPVYALNKDPRERQGRGRRQRRPNTPPGKNPPKKPPRKPRITM